MDNIIPVGCTAVNTFTYPFTEDETETIYITYRQTYGTAVEKDINDITFGEENKISVNLTQTDTLKFKQNENVEIQIRAKLTNGTAVKSNIVTTQSDRLLKKGEI